MWSTFRSSARRAGTNWPTALRRCIDEGFDPRNPAQYIAKMKADRALPGMPTEAEWEHNSIGTGEMHCRLWLATEMLAIAFAALHDRVVALEGATRD